MLLLNLGASAHERLTVLDLTRVTSGGEATVQTDGGLSLKEHSWPDFMIVVGG